MKALRGALALLPLGLLAGCVADPAPPRPAEVPRETAREMDRLRADLAAAEERADDLRREKQTLERDVAWLRDRERLLADELVRERKQADFLQAQVEALSSLKQEREKLQGLIETLREENDRLRRRLAAQEP